MSRSRLPRSHSTDGLLRRIPSFCSSDRYDNQPRSSPRGEVCSYGSEFTPHYHDRYQQSSARNKSQHTKRRSQSKQHHVTWGSMPKYSSDRDRFSNYSGGMLSRDSRHNSHSQPQTSSDSCCPIHGHSRQGHDVKSIANRANFERRIYDSHLYPLNSNLYYSNLSNQIRQPEYHQASSNPFGDYNYGTPKYCGRTSRSLTYSYVRDPLLDLRHHPSYGSFSRNPSRSMLTSPSNFQRSKSPTWRRSGIGLNLLSLSD